MPNKDLLLEQLNKMISDGQFPEQSKLPPERDLAEKLNATRAKLRKALAVMEAEGKIWRHVGRGTFVGCPPIDDNTSFPSIARSTNPMEIMEARLVVEPKLAGFAAIRATPAEIAQMYQCVEKSELAIETNIYELWDATLHRMIAEAAHNYLLLSVLNVINTMRQDKLWGRLKKAVVTTEKMAEYSRHHLACVKAIENRYVADAEQAMIMHLEIVSRDILSVAGNIKKL
jgi:DNA-binding FadR family transcriptional regulator